jgi:hypothetical protein
MGDVSQAGLWVAHIICLSIGLAGKPRQCLPGQPGMMVVWGPQIRPLLHVTRH